MKKAILMTMLCILSSLSMRGADYDYLVFTLTDNTTQAVTASNITLAVSGTNLVVTSGSSTLATFPLSNLSSMQFSNDGSTGIQTITANTLISDDSTVIYDMNGRQMPRNASLPKGVYILKNNGKSIKMQIK